MTPSVPRTNSAGIAALIRGGAPAGAVARRGALWAGIAAARWPVGTSPVGASTGELAAESAGECGLLTTVDHLMPGS